MTYLYWLLIGTVIPLVFSFVIEKLIWNKGKCLYCKTGNLIFSKKNWFFGYIYVCDNEKCGKPAYFRLTKKGK